MKNNDVELIQSVLSGDENAFSELVNKHKKAVHALAWRVIGDFHIAEEITQDTFLIVYQRLHTLKDPNQFLGWLYVIARRRCYAWLRKKRIRTQPLEDAETTMIGKDVYSQHVADERANTAIDVQSEVVKRLLAKLKESERTVMTLHYLGEMKVEEISKFLGVSVGTIKSRLQRARNRLQKEETMIREALEHFKLSPNLTDNIMQEVSRLKPTASTSKPLVPWAIAATSAILIVFMLGIGSQQLLRFQQPYTLDAQSEMTVELVDVPIVLNLDVKPEVRRELGNSKAFGESDNNGQNPDEILFTNTLVNGEDISNQKQKWIQAKRVKGAPAMNLCTTPDGNLYVLTNYHSVYRLSNDDKPRQHLPTINKLITAWGGAYSIAKWDDTLYLITHNEFFTSTDDGETWDLLYSWKGTKFGFPIELILTEQAFYLAFRSGVFQSKDNGKTWINISHGLEGRTEHFIDSLIEIQNTLFAGTNNGCYRYSDDSWERLEFPFRIQEVASIATGAGKLYVAARLGWKESKEVNRTWAIFRSTDLGDSWKDISPTNAWQLDGNPPNMVLIAVRETLLAMEHGMVRSMDSGDTWLSPQSQDTSPSMGNLSPTAVIDDQTIYVGSNDGLYYSNNLGESWHKMNIRQKGGRIYNLIALKKSDRNQSIPPTLYAIVDGETQSADEIQKTDDEGNTWKPVQVAKQMTDPIRRISPNSTQIVKSNDVLYAKGRGAVFGSKKVYIHRVSSNGRTLEPIQGMPALNSEKLSNALALGATQFFKQLEQPKFENGGELRKNLIEKGLEGVFAVIGDAFYVEYNYKLFRWELGDTEFYDTKQEETIELTKEIIKKDLKLAVTGDTVYVGKRDGNLLVSLDRGNNWIDLTSALPFTVRTFNDILIVNDTVYIATDAGVATSDQGNNWGVVTDSEGTNLIMEHLDLAVDVEMLYGVTKDAGIYRLENGTWNQIVSEIPEKITSLAVDRNTIYVGTQDQGMLHFNF